MKVSITHDLPGRPEVVRAALLRQDTWDRFLDGGKAVERRIQLDQEACKGTVSWVNHLSDDVPGMIKTLVGRCVRVELRFQLRPGQEGHIELDGLDGRAKLRSTLHVDPKASDSRVHINGDFRLSGGPFNVAARFEGQAWTELVKPIFVEELLPLLR